MKIAHLCSAICNPMEWNFPGQNTGVGSLSHLQGILPTQGLNPGLPQSRQILYQLSHKGSPLSPLLTINLLSIFVSLFLFCKQNHFLLAFSDFTYKWHHIIFVFLCLTSFSMIISRSYNVATKGIISFFSIAE